MARRFRDPGRPERKAKPLREPKSKIIIVSEGKRTEPAYFREFARLNGNGLVVIVVHGLGADPMSVVGRAIEEYEEMARKARKERDSFAKAFEVWAVFDRDEHPQFETPIQKAEARNIQVAYSNPCFELWGLLHYWAVDAPLDRHAAQRELRKEHPGYHHQDRPVLDAASMQGKPYEDAVRNADRALARRREEGEARGNPSTTVHRLTEQIRKFGRS